jgi:hypothetical protein
VEGVMTPCRTGCLPANAMPASGVPLAVVEAEPW